MTSECLWSYDEDGVWETACKQSFSIIDGTPEQNDMRFCCYCGGKLQQKLKEDAEYASPL